MVVTTGITFIPVDIRVGALYTSCETFIPAMELFIPVDTSGRSVLLYQLLLMVDLLYQWTSGWNFLYQWIPGVELFIPVDTNRVFY